MKQLALPTLVVGSLLSLSVAGTATAATDLPWPETLPAQVEAVRAASIPTGERAAAGEVNVFTSFGCVRTASAAFGSQAEPFDSFAFLKLFTEPMALTTTAPGFLLIFR